MKYPGGNTLVYLKFNLDGVKVDEFTSLAFAESSTRKDGFPTTMTRIQKAFKDDPYDIPGNHYWRIKSEMDTVIHPKDIPPEKRKTPISKEDAVTISENGKLISSIGREVLMYEVTDLERLHPTPFPSINAAFRHLVDIGNGGHDRKSITDACDNPNQERLGHYWAWGKPK